MYNGYSSSPTVTNCILWTDWPNEFEGDAANVRYSDVQGGYAGDGNIDVDPLFVNSGSGDLRIQHDSPCVDAGDNTAVPNGITTDLDGNPRFLDVACRPDTGNGTAPI